MGKFGEITDFEPKPTRFLAKNGPFCGFSQNVNAQKRVFLRSKIADRIFFAERGVGLKICARVHPIFWPSSIEFLAQKMRYRIFGPKNSMLLARAKKRENRSFWAIFAKSRLTSSESTFGPRTPRNGGPGARFGQRAKSGPPGVWLHL